MSNPAPGTLETVRLFVNTVDVDEGTDELADPAQLASWLAAHGVLAERSGGPAASAGDLRRALELREALRAQLRAHHGDALDPRTAAVLDGAARRARLTLRFEDGDTTVLEPQAPGVDGALGRLLAIVKSSIDDGSWRRLKICASDSCQWAFYDESRNRSGVWCDMAVCGNRAKVREFRQRSRPARSAGQGG